MPDSVDDILRVALRCGFLLIPVMFMVIFLVLVNREHPFSNGNRKNTLTQHSRFLHTPGQFLFERIAELPFNLINIILLLPGRSTRCTRS
jgi:hypothetical protein